MTARPGRGPSGSILLLTVLIGIACTSTPARRPTPPPPVRSATMRELRQALARWRDEPTTVTYRTERQRPGLPMSAHQCLRRFVDERSDIPEALRTCDPGGVVTLVWDPPAGRWRLDVTEAGTTIAAIVDGDRGLVCTHRRGCRSRMPAAIVRSFPFHELIEPVESTLADAGIDPSGPAAIVHRTIGGVAVDCFEMASAHSAVAWCFGGDGWLRSLRIRIEGRGPTIAEAERTSARVAGDAFDPLAA